MPASLLLAAAPAIMQAVQGISQIQGGKKQLSGLERPLYEIPTAAKQSLGLAASAYANQKMPGEDLALSRIGQNMSNYLRASRDNSNPQAGLAMGLAAANRSSNEIAVASAQNQEQDRRVLMSNLDTYAKYQDQQFQMNKYAPYVDNYNEGRERIGAGTQNLFGALNGLSAVGMQSLAGKAAPITPAQMSDARSTANQAQAQDSFITATGKNIGSDASKAWSAAQAAAPGLTPQQLMNFITRFNGF